MEEEKKQQSQQEEKEQDKKKYTLKVVVTTAIATLLLIAILLLCVLFGLKNCSGHSKDNTSSELPIDTERNNKITDVFIDIVNKQMTFDGYDSDELKSVVAITYEDSYPTKFGLNIIVNSDSKVYYYYAEDVTYPDNKDGYDDFVSYLLKEDSNHILDGDISLSVLDKSEATFDTSKETYKVVVSKDISDNKYLSGFTYEEDSFFIYQKRLLTEGEDPFTGVGDQKISSGDQLYDYYRGLLA